MHQRSHLSVLIIFAVTVTVILYSSLPVSAGSQSLTTSSFSVALETLQKHLNYEFQNIGYLRRAMTHSSYSEENNKAFSILGESIIETVVSLKLLKKDVDISSKDLNNQISEISKVDTSCAVDGMRLGLQNVVRVSSSTDGSTSSVVCGAFRAIFGAVALDTGKSDDAGNVFLAVHGGAGGSLSIYEFKNIGYLRRAMTHSSYFEENNQAFSILGESIIETVVSLKLLTKDVDISSKDLNNQISEISKVDTSCAVDGMRLGLQNVVRVSSSTDASTSSVVCGAFRAIFGAVALDTGKSDDAGNVFLAVHGGAGGSLSM